MSEHRFLKYLAKNNKLLFDSKTKIICEPTYNYSYKKYDISKISTVEADYINTIPYQTPSQKYFLPKTITIYEKYEKYQKEDDEDDNYHSSKFNFIKKIGEGSYGGVFLYVNNKNDAFVIKYGDIKDDSSIIKYLKKHNICLSSFVPSIFIDNFYIMELMDGTLSDLSSRFQINNLNVDQVLKISYYLVNDLECLAKNNLFYTDIKAFNVLYSCNNDDTYSIVLADIGSTANMNNVSKSIVAVATYPPANRIVKTNENKNIMNGVFNNPNDKDVVWGIGILIFYLFGINVKKYDYVNSVEYVSYLGALDNDITKDIATIIEYLQIYTNITYSILQKLVHMFNMILEFDETKRINLSNLKQILLDIILEIEKHPIKPKITKSLLKDDLYRDNSQTYASLGTLRTVDSDIRQDFQSLPLVHSDVGQILPTGQSDNNQQQEQENPELLMGQELQGIPFTRSDSF
jgi:serine/threonine protein kinase